MAAADTLLVVAAMCAESGLEMGIPAARAPQGCKPRRSMKRSWHDDKDDNDGASASAASGRKVGDEDFILSRSSAMCLGRVLSGGEV